MEQLTLGIQVVLIGMGVVIIALTLLAVLTASMSKILADKQANPKKDFEKTNKVSAPTIKEPVQTEQEGELTPEILAVITAAAASTINTRSTYKITTIKRINHDLSPNWRRLGRYEQTI
ncbi:OadG family protein [Desulfitibacter alkalitolerans]|uniref:OadG family protein n=1 Tax=Desulfitibacter alkalitolerans TaxID=264641 RepID=UPI000484F64E|nr:OadG family protein [Desulfitibacter alkalitolerans]